jgi:hypothetical protein
VTTITHAAAVEESGLLSNNLVEKEVMDFIPSIDAATLGLALFDSVFSSGIENLLN